jgi:hypothetical protein
MVMDGLHTVGEDGLAHELAVRHVQMVARTAAETGTIWENWSPERAEPGSGARPCFVGWGAASSITAGLEHALGIRCTHDVVEWDVRLLERHGVRRLPVRHNATMDLLIAARASQDEPPRLTAVTDARVEIRLTWAGGGVRSIVLEEGVGHDES